MKVLVVLAACAAIVAARPEPPVGGYYNNYHHGGHHGGGGHVGHVGHGGHGGHGGHSGYNYAQPQPVLSGSVGQFSGGAATATASTGASAFDSLGGFGGSSSFSGGSSSFSGASSQAATFGAPQQQIVQKHIYVHVPPQETEQTFQQQIVAPGLRQKHYKIIFIKTPSVQSSAAQLALQQSLTEEKTIVYVLVKKPDSIDNINLPVPPVTKPSKPEVYFIKYKTNSEQVPLQGISGSSASATSSSQSDAGIVLSSSGGATSAAVSGAGAISSSGVANLPAQTYGVPAHHHGHGYH